MKRSAWTCLLVLAAASPARADGFFAPRVVAVGESAPMAVSPRQEALIVFDGERVEVTLRTHFRAGPEELAWVVPVPVVPDEVRASSDAVFTELEQATAPQFHRLIRGGRGLGCGCGAASLALHEASTSVIVQAAGTAGIFDWTVLTSARGGDLVRWLRDNRYALPPGAEPLFALYVEAGWHWLAMKVRPEETRKPTLAPHPIAYAYRDDRLVYPLVISRLSADAESEVLLYVLGPNRFAPANWPHAVLDTSDLARDPSSPSGTTYEAMFRREAAARGGRLFVTEYASDLDHVNGRPLLKLITGRDPLGERLPATFLARLRAVAAPDAMDRDVVLAPLEDGGPVTNRHFVRAGDRSRGALGLSVLALAGAGVVAARFLEAAGRGSMRLAGVLVFALSLLALGTL